MTQKSFIQFIAVKILLISSAYALDLENSPEAEIRKSQPLAVTTSASISSNLYKNSSSDYSLNSDLALDPSLTLEDGTTLIGHLSLYKDLRGERKEELNDAYIGGIKTIFRHGPTSISFLGLGFIPLSERSYKDQKLQTGIMLAPTFNLSLEELMLPGLRVSLRPSYRQNFHKFKTSLSGNSNFERTLSTSLTLSYYATDALLLTSRNTYSRSFTYNGNETDSYRFEQSLTYLFTARASLTFGHLNGGNPLAANGIDTEVQFLNRRSSTVYTSVSYTF